MGFESVRISLFSIYKHYFFWFGFLDHGIRKCGQVNWPTKTFVNTWMKNETILATMIGLLKKVPYKLHGQEVSATLDMSPERKPLAKAHALFYKGLKEL